MICFGDERCASYCFIYFNNILRVVLRVQDVDLIIIMWNIYTRFGTPFISCTCTHILYFVLRALLTHDYSAAVYFVAYAVTSRFYNGSQCLSCDSLNIEGVAYVRCLRVCT